MGAAICPHCLTNLNNQVSVCPNCGGQTDISTPPFSLPVGSILSDQRGHSFAIGKVIGDGGFGKTYIAKELSSGRIVAIKEYFPKICSPYRQGFTLMPSTSPEAFEHGLQSFLKEATMLRAVVNIPSIVHVLDYFRANNSAYVVMEYLNGQTLRSIVERSGAIPFRSLLPKLRVLMNDIAQLHDAGVIHRDIAPDNIMMMPDGSLKLLDFGCARSMEDGRAMTVILKPGFAPVEQYQTRGQSYCTDIYALCATVYYCVTGGKVPPGSPERQIAIAGNLPDPLLYPIALGAQMSPANEQVLLWGLSVRPENRPQKMSDLASRFVNEAQVTSFSNSTNTNTTDSINGWQPSLVNPPSDPKGSGSTWKIVVAILAAIVVILIVLAVGLAVSKKGNDDRPAHAAPNNQTNQDVKEPVAAKDPPATEPKDDGTVAGDKPVATEPMPEPEPQTVTDGDYTYVLTDDGRAVLVEYSGDEEFISIPDYYDHNPVISISAGAVSNKSLVKDVLLPTFLESIEDGAFDNCSNLRCIQVYSDVTSGSPFKNCGKLRCILYGSYGNDSVSKWDLPKNVKTFSLFDEYDMLMPPDDDLVCQSFTASLFAASVDELGVIYGLTYDEDVALILDVPSGLKELWVPETISTSYGDYDVTWAADSAFDNVGSDFKLLMHRYFFMNEDVYGKIKYQQKDTGYIGDSLIWAINGELTERINKQRSASNKVAWDTTLATASLVRAIEIADVLDGGSRPDGSKWYTILDDVSYEYPDPNATNYNGFWFYGGYIGGFGADQIKDMVAELESNFVGEDINYMGTAVFYNESDDTYYYYFIAVGPSN